SPSHSTQPLSEPTTHQTSDHPAHQQTPLRASPDGPVRAVRNAIREAIGEVRGEVPEKAEGFTPHVSVAYSIGDGPTEPIAQVLADLNLPPAHARISTAELIVIHRDNQMYEWETFAKVPLG
ncbi:2'-5' RNA ligase family protein, partial [Streptomyces sp. NPDC050704]|uniref:2'-5' RNA ligase family protein n=1 Tax=Streptomyces sp. NPDC050704 TaxID=3157219 RepID=UPI0034435928